MSRACVNNDLFISSFILGRDSYNTCIRLKSLLVNKRPTIRKVCEKTSARIFGYNVAMAFRNEEINALPGIILLLLVVRSLPLAAAANIDCNGKPFHCINSSHFMICVDIGGGLSSTIDSYVIPCPPPTVCHQNNSFECEFPRTTTAPLLVSLKVSTQSSGTEITTPWNQNTTITDIPAQTTETLIDQNFNTVSSTTVSENNSAKLLTQQNEVTTIKSIQAIENVNKLTPVDVLYAESAVETSTIKTTIGNDQNIVDVELTSPMPTEKGTIKNNTISNSTYQNIIAGTYATDAESSTIDKIGPNESITIQQVMLITNSENIDDIGVHIKNETKSTTAVHSQDFNYNASQNVVPTSFSQNISNRSLTTDIVTTTGIADDELSVSKMTEDYPTSINLDFNTNNTNDTVANKISTATSDTEHYTIDEIQPIATTIATSTRKISEIVIPNEEYSSTSDVNLQGSNSVLGRPTTETKNVTVLIQDSSISPNKFSPVVVTNTLQTADSTIIIATHNHNTTLPSTYTTENVIPFALNKENVTLSTYYDSGLLTTVAKGSEITSDLGTVFRPVTTEILEVQKMEGIEKNKTIKNYDTELEVHIKSDAYTHETNSKINDLASSPTQFSGMQSASNQFNMIQAKIDINMHTTSPGSTENNGLAPSVISSLNEHNHNPELLSVATITKQPIKNSATDNTDHVYTAKGAEITSDLGTVMGPVTTKVIEAQTVDGIEKNVAKTTYDTESVTEVKHITSDSFTNETNTNINDLASSPTQFSGMQSASNQSNMVPAKIDLNMHTISPGFTQTSENNGLATSVTSSSHENNHNPEFLSVATTTQQPVTNSATDNIDHVYTAKGAEITSDLGTVMWPVTIKAIEAQTMDGIERNVAKTTYHTESVTEVRHLTSDGLTNETNTKINDLASSPTQFSGMQSASNQFNMVPAKIDSNMHRTSPGFTQTSENNGLATSVTSSSNEHNHNPEILSVATTTQQPITNYASDNIDHVYTAKGTEITSDLGIVMRPVTTKVIEAQTMDGIESNMAKTTYHTEYVTEVRHLTSDGLTNETNTKIFDLASSPTQFSGMQSASNHFNMVPAKIDYNHNPELLSLPTTTQQQITNYASDNIDYVYTAKGAGIIPKPVTVMWPVTTEVIDAQTMDGIESSVAKTTYDTESVTEVRHLTSDGITPMTNSKMNDLASSATPLSGMQSASNQFNTVPEKIDSEMLITSSGFTQESENNGLATSVTSSSNEYDHNPELLSLPTTTQQQITNYASDNIDYVYTAKGAGITLKPVTVMWPVTTKVIDAQTMDGIESNVAKTTYDTESVTEVRHLTSDGITTTTNSKMNDLASPATQLSGIESASNQFNTVSQKIDSDMLITSSGFTQESENNGLATSVTSSSIEYNHNPELLSVATTTQQPIATNSATDNINTIYTAKGAEITSDLGTVMRPVTTKVIEAQTMDGIESNVAKTTDDTETVTEVRHLTSDGLTNETNTKINDLTSSPTQFSEMQSASNQFNIVPAKIDSNMHTTSTGFTQTSENNGLATSVASSSNEHNHNPEHVSAATQHPITNSASDNIDYVYTAKGAGIIPKPVTVMWPVTTEVIDAQTMDGIESNVAKTTYDTESVTEVRHLTSDGITTTTNSKMNDLASPATQLSGIESASNQFNTVSQKIDSDMLITSSGFTQESENNGLATSVTSSSNEYNHNPELLSLPTTTQQQITNYASDNIDYVYTAKGAGIIPKHVTVMWPVTTEVIDAQTMDGIESSVAKTTYDTESVTEVRHLTSDGITPKTNSKMNDLASSATPLSGMQTASNQFNTVPEKIDSEMLITSSGFTQESENNGLATSVTSSSNEYNHNPELLSLPTTTQQQITNYASDNIDYVYTAKGAGITPKPVTVMWPVTTEVIDAQTMDGIESNVTKTTNDTESVTKMRHLTSDDITTEVNSKLNDLASSATQSSGMQLVSNGFNTVPEIIDSNMHTTSTGFTQASESNGFATSVTLSTNEHYRNAEILSVAITTQQPIARNSATDNINTIYTAKGTEITLDSSTAMWPVITEIIDAQTVDGIESNVAKTTYDTESVTDVRHLTSDGITTKTNSKMNDLVSSATQFSAMQSASNQFNTVPEKIDSDMLITSSGFTQASENNGLAASVTLYTNELYHNPELLTVAITTQQPDTNSATDNIYHVYTAKGAKITSDLGTVMRPAITKVIEAQTMDGIENNVAKTTYNVESVTEVIHITSDGFTNETNTKINDLASSPTRYSGMKSASNQFNMVPAKRDSDTHTSSPGFTQTSENYGLATSVTASSNEHNHNPELLSVATTTQQPITNSATDNIDYVYTAKGAEMTPNPVTVMWPVTTNVIEAQTMDRIENYVAKTTYNIESVTEVIHITSDGFTNETNTKINGFASSPTQFSGMQSASHQFNTVPEKIDSDMLTTSSEFTQTSENNGLASSVILLTNEFYHNPELLTVDITTQQPITNSASDNIDYMYTAKAAEITPKPGSVMWPVTTEVIEAQTVDGIESKVVKATYDTESVTKVRHLTSDGITTETNSKMNDLESSATQFSGMQSVSNQFDTVPEIIDSNMHTTSTGFTQASESNGLATSVTLSTNEHYSNAEILPAATTTKQPKPHSATDNIDYMYTAKAAEITPKPGSVMWPVTTEVIEAQTVDGIESNVVKATYDTESVTKVRHLTSDGITTETNSKMNDLESSATQFSGMQSVSNQFDTVPEIIDSNMHTTSTGFTQASESNGLATSVTLSTNEHYRNAEILPAATTTKQPKPHSATDNIDHVYTAKGAEISPIPGTVMWPVTTEVIETQTMDGIKSNVAKTTNDTESVTEVRRLTSDDITTDMNSKLNDLASSATQSSGMQLVSNGFNTVAEIIDSNMHTTSTGFTQASESNGLATSATLSTYEHYHSPELLTVAPTTQQLITNYTPDNIDYVYYAKGAEITSDLGTVMGPVTTKVIVAQTVDGIENNVAKTTYDTESVTEVKHITSDSFTNETNTNINDLASSPTQFSGMQSASNKSNIVPAKIDSNMHTPSQASENNGLVTFVTLSSNELYHKPELLTVTITSQQSITNSATDNIGYIYTAKGAEITPKPGTVIWPVTTEVIETQTMDGIESNVAKTTYDPESVTDVRHLTSDGITKKNSKMNDIASSATQFSGMQSASNQFNMVPEIIDSNMLTTLPGFTQASENNGLATSVTVSTNELYHNPELLTVATTSQINEFYVTTEPISSTLYSEIIDTIGIVQPKDSYLDGESSIIKPSNLESNTKILSNNENSTIQSASTEKSPESSIHVPVTVSGNNTEKRAEIKSNDNYTPVQAVTIELEVSATEFSINDSNMNYSTSNDQFNQKQNSVNLLPARVDSVNAFEGLSTNNHESMPSSNIYTDLSLPNSITEDTNSSLTQRPKTEEYFIVSNGASTATPSLNTDSEYIDQTQDDIGRASNGKNHSINHNISDQNKQNTTQKPIRLMRNTTQTETQITTHEYVNKQSRNNNNIRVNKTSISASNDPHVNRDRSTTNTEVSIDCRYYRRGRYADNEDCRKFYICIGKRQPIIGLCPVNTVFSEINKQCTKNLSHCIRNNQFHCTSEGRFSHFLKDNVYYICLKNGFDTFVRFKLQCQYGYHLNKTAVRCIRNYERKSQSSFDSDNSRRNSGQSISKTKLGESGGSTSSSEGYICKEEGKFGDPKDCRVYYVCSKHNKYGFRRKKKMCDSDEVFHKDKKKCIDAESDEC